MRRISKYTNSFLKLFGLMTISRHDEIKESTKLLAQRMFQITSLKSTITKHEVLNKKLKDTNSSLTKVNKTINDDMKWLLRQLVDTSSDTDYSEYFLTNGGINRQELTKVIINTKCVDDLKPKEFDPSARAGEFSDLYHLINCITVTGNWTLKPANNGLGMIIKPLQTEGQHV